jgi:imidazolonepropionase-like amidohydrolase
MRYKLIHYLYILFSISITFSSCDTVRQTSTIDSQKVKNQEEDIYALENVNIIPMTSGNKIIKNGTAVIKDKKIFSINQPVPSEAKIIDCRGKWLIPGLTDMHVHNLADVNFSAPYPTKGATLFADTQNLMTLYIANGVTTVFELSARVEHFGQRNEIIKGNVIGPRIALAFFD